MENIGFQLGDRVKIINGFFSSKEAFNLSSKNGVKDWKPIGEIIKIPGNNDNILPKEETGNDEDLIDNYHIKLDIPPHKKWNPIVTYLEFKDLNKIN